MTLPASSRESEVDLSSTRVEKLSEYLVFSYAGNYVDVILKFNSTFCGAHFMYSLCSLETGNCEIPQKLRRERPAPMKKPVKAAYLEKSYCTG